MTTTFDQTERVYAAQSEAGAFSLTFPLGNRFPDAEAYLRHVRTSLDLPPVKLKCENHQPYHGLMGYSEYPDKIRLYPEGHGSPFTVLHELAHLLVNRMVGADNDGGHGPLFCRTLLDLVYEFLSRDGAEHLRRAFRRHGVRVADGYPTELAA